DRDYANTVEEAAGFTYDKKFIDFTTPVEMNVFGDNVAIIALKEEPIIFVLRDPDTAASLLEYFHKLWKLAER
ncbi:MAG: hypothetical protein ABEI52_12250, partial [Halobacteriaceae archaeon]